MRNWNTELIMHNSSYFRRRSFSSLISRSRILFFSNSAFLSAILKQFWNLSYARKNGWKNFRREKYCYGSGGRWADWVGDVKARRFWTKVGQSKKYYISSIKTFVLDIMISIHTLRLITKTKSKLWKYVLVECFVRNLQLDL